MSIKILKGLGYFSDPFSQFEQESSTSILGQTTSFLKTSNSTDISVDMSIVPDESFFASNGTIYFNRPPPSADTFATADGNVTVADSNSESQLFSLDSAVGPFDTLFHDFEFQAIPFFNFWEEDESINTYLHGDSKLENLPRYIHLKWKTCPNFNTGKRIPSFDVSPVDSRFSDLYGRSKSDAFFSVKGITFFPEHLNNFSLIAHSLANKFLCSGMLMSIVNVPVTPNFVRPSTTTACKVDDDLFLMHPDTVGFSINEIDSNINSLTNTLSKVSAVYDVSRNLKSEERPDQGNFSISLNTLTKNNFSVSSINPSISPLSYNGKISSFNKTNDQNAVEFLAQKISFLNEDSQQKSISPKITFIDSALTAINSADRTSSMTSIEHAENIAAISGILPLTQLMSSNGFNIIEKDLSIPSFPSPSNVNSVEYVGYLIEKYKRNVFGAFELVEEIEIDDESHNEFIDSKVLYGAIYRYRIRSLIRWTRPGNIGVMGRVKSETSPHASQTKTLAFNQSSYFGSEWSKNWCYAAVVDFDPPNPPDEMTARPDSISKKVTLTCKLPLNKQRDISAMRFFKKTQKFNDEYSVWEDISSWAQLQTISSNGSILKDFPAGNVLFEDYEVDAYQTNRIRYVYASQTVSYHGHTSQLSDQLGVRINLDYKRWGEFDVDFVSQKGVSLESFGFCSTIPFSKIFSEIVSKEGRFEFSGRVTLPNVSNELSKMMLDDSTYIARIESLDTGEISDFRFDIKNINLENRVVENYSTMTTSAMQSSAKKSNFSIITKKVKDLDKVSVTKFNPGARFVPMRNDS
jgi:hypothetical protein